MREHLFGSIITHLDPVVYLLSLRLTHRYGSPQGHRPHRQFFPNGIIPATKEPNIQLVMDTANGDCILIPKRRNSRPKAVLTMSAAVPWIGVSTRSGVPGCRNRQVAHGTGFKIVAMDDRKQFDNALGALEAFFNITPESESTSERYNEMVVLYSEIEQSKKHHLLEQKAIEAEKNTKSKENCREEKKGLRKSLKTNKRDVF